MSEKPKKHRPEITLRCPATVYPGQPFVATVTLQAKAPVDVEFVKVGFEGRMRGSIGSGDGRRSKRVEFCSLAAELCQERRLKKGANEFRCKLEVPSGSPASYSTRDAEISYALSVRASIAWWPDAKESFEIRVGLDKPAAPHPGTRRLSASEEQPRGVDPYIETSLVQDVFTPGEVVSGSVAFSNVAHNRYAGARLTVIGTEHVHMGKRAKHRTKPTRLEFLLSMSPEEGKAYPFRFRLPEHLPPTHSTGFWNLSYALRIEARRNWARDISIDIPITLVPRRFESAVAPERTGLPSIGSERVEAVWRAAGAACGLILEGEALRGSISGVRVMVSRDHRGREGTFIVGELDYSSLGLDLIVQRGGRLPLLGRDDIQVGVSAWDRRHRVDGRDREQTGGFLRDIGSSLCWFRWALMSDEHLRVETKDAGTQPMPVRDITARIVVLAEALATARKQIPAPTPMLDQVEPWTALANDLAGSLDHVRMEVHGTINGLAASVRTIWTDRGEPLHTVVELESQLPIDASHTFESFEPIDIESCPIQDRDCRAILRRITVDAQMLRIAHDGIRIHLAAPLPHPSSIPRTLRSMSQLIQQLAPNSGPYR